MKRILFTSLAVILLLLICAVGAAFVLLTNSLPQLDGEVAIEGLTAEVSIDRDGQGIPSITASNRQDLAFATGFVHGQDRFFQMDLTRRNAAGELAEIVGAAALPLDRRHRLHRFRHRAAKVIEQLEHQQLQVLHAYAAGVNAGLENLDAKPFEYFLLNVEPKSWQAADTLLVLYSMYLQLNDATASRDIGRGTARRGLPETAFNWLYPNATDWDAPLDEAVVDEPSRMPTAAEFSVDSQQFALVGDGEMWAEQPQPGSNNWAVAGKLTDSGGAIVANDMHLRITVPNIFYRARMRVDDASGIAQDIDLNGLTLPGAPLLIAGSNGQVAWSNTNSNGDWSDAVIVVPGDAPDTYLTPDGQLPILAVTEMINVKDQDPVSFEIRETKWGPILEPAGDGAHTYAVSWIAHHVEGASLGHLNLETAKTASAALAIANTIGIPPQNFVVGDAEGNIGWTIAGKIPARMGDADSSLPMDWSVAEGWNGWLSPDDYPRIVNPESGRIWTANARVVGGEALNIIRHGGYALGARAKQIKDDLFAFDQFSPDDMLSIHLDDRALFLQRWRDLLLQILDEQSLAGNPARLEFHRQVRDWSARASVDSVGYRFVTEFRTETRDRVIRMLLSAIFERADDVSRPVVSRQFEQPLWSMVSEKPAHLLTRDYADWDDLLRRAVDSVIADQHADGLKNRTWGEANTAAIRHPLSRFVPMLSRWLDMPADQLAGDGNMPRVQYPDYGASERFAVSPGDEVGGYLHMPAGQSGHPWSDFYFAGHDDWVQGRASDFLPGETRYSLVLNPIN